MRVRVKSERFGSFEAEVREVRDERGSLMFKRGLAKAMVRALNLALEFAFVTGEPSSFTVDVLP